VVLPDRCARPGAPCWHACKLGYDKAQVLAEGGFEGLA
jgi:hypothetical protein